MAAGRLFGPGAVLTAHRASKRLFVADPQNARVAMLEAASRGAVRVLGTFGGSDAIGGSFFREPTFALPTDNGDALMVCDAGSGRLCRVDVASGAMQDVHPPPPSALRALLSAALPARWTAAPKSVFQPVRVSTDGDNLIVVDRAGALWRVSAAGDRVQGPLPNDARPFAAQALSAVSSDLFALRDDGALLAAADGALVTVSAPHRLGLPRSDAFEVIEAPLQLVPRGRVHLRIPLTASSGVALSEPVQSVRIMTEGSLIDRALLERMQPGTSIRRRGNEWEPGVSAEDLEEYTEPPVLPRWDGSSNNGGPRMLQVDLHAARGTGYVVADMAAYFEPQAAAYIRLVVPLRVYDYGEDDAEAPTLITVPVVLSPNGASLT